MGDWRHILFGRSKKGNVMAGLVALMGGGKIWEEGFGEKPERRRPLEPRHGWKDNTTVDLKEIRKIAKVDY
jgi:hypothetical protein